MNAPCVSLNDGLSMPQLGFGVWQIESAEAATAVAEALSVGYRAVDSAAIYGNEESVGAAIRDSGIPRSEIHLTTKLWSDHHHDAEAGLRQSLARLGLDSVDLFLIHWPNNELNRYVEAWKGLIACQEAGLTKSIGVSNFHVQHLQRLFDETSITPAVNQVELHPYLQQAELRQFNADHGILTEAWSPLGQGKILDDPVIRAVAARHGKTPAQAILRWHLDIGNIVIPKSVTPARIAENFNVFDFKLTDADLAEIASLDRGQRFGGNPDTATW